MYRTEGNSLFQLLNTFLYLMKTFFLNAFKLIIDKSAIRVAYNSICDEASESVAPQSGQYCTN